MVSAGRGWSGRVVGWAAGRAVAPNSVTAISLLLALCATAWFSGGTKADHLRGLLALAGWAATRIAARGLSAVTAAEPGNERSFGWLFAVCTVAAECAIYGGIAAGAEADGWTGTWPLAVVTVILVSVAEIAAQCGRALTGTTAPVRVSIPGKLASAVLPPPVGARVLIASLVMIRYGPRMALFTVFAIETISLARTMTKLARLGPDRPAGRSVLAASSAGLDVVLACRDDGPFARWTGKCVKGNLMPLPAAVAGLVAIVLLAVLGFRGLPGIIALTPVIVLLLAAPGSSHPHDGRFDWLAPVLLCLAQYSYFTAFGLARGVPGPVIFTLCAMVAVWYAGITARQPVGRLERAAVITSRAERVRQIVARPADGFGWETRVCVVGLSGMFGIATFGYLGLSACLAVLMCRKVVIGYLIPGGPQ